MSMVPVDRVDVENKSYKQYDQQHEYSHDIGLVVLPVAGRESNHRVIRLHGGYALRRVRWQASRSTTPPFIPAAADTRGDTLLSATVMPHLPRYNPTNQSFDFAVSGEYLYVQNVPRVAGVNAFPCGELPYLLPSMQKAATELCGSRLSSLLGGAGGQTNIIDSITEDAVYKIDQLVRKDETIFWPFTALPAAFTSTHIIGG